MANETVEEFLARGGKIKEVCKGGADKCIAYLDGKPYRLNSRYHYGEATVGYDVMEAGRSLKRAKWAGHSKQNKSGCKINQ